MLIKLVLAKLHQSCWNWLNQQCFCCFLGFVLNLEINAGYRNISIPFPFGISFHTERCSFWRYSSNTSSFYFESQTPRNSPVPLFGLFCRHWRPLWQRPWNCLNVVHLSLSGNFYRQFVGIEKVCSRCGDCIFNFFRCCEFPSNLSDIYLGLCCQWL